MAQGEGKTCVEVETFQRLIRQIFFIGLDEICIMALNEFLHFLIRLRLVGQELVNRIDI